MLISSMLVINQLACTTKTASPSSARSFVHGDGGRIRSNLCCFVLVERDVARENI